MAHDPADSDAEMAAVAAGEATAPPPPPPGGSSSAPFASVGKAWRRIAPLYWGSDACVAKLARYFAKAAIEMAFPSHAQRGALLRLALMLAALAVVNQLPGFQGLAAAPWYADLGGPEAERFLVLPATESIARLLHGILLRGAQAAARTLMPLAEQHASLAEGAKGRETLRERLESTFAVFIAGKSGGVHLPLDKSARKIHNIHVTDPNSGELRAAQEDDLISTVTSTDNFRIGLVTNPAGDARSRAETDLMVFFIPNGGSNYTYAAIPYAAWGAFHGRPPSLMLTTLKKRAPAMVHRVHDAATAAAAHQHTRDLQFPERAAVVLADCAMLIRYLAKVVCMSRTAAAGAPHFREGYGAGLTSEGGYEQGMVAAAGQGAGLVSDGFADFSALGLCSESKVGHPVLRLVSRIRQNLHDRGVTFPTSVRTSPSPSPNTDKLYDLTASWSRSVKFPAMFGANRPSPPMSERPDVVVVWVQQLQDAYGFSDLDKEALLTMSEAYAMPINFRTAVKRQYDAHDQAAAKKEKTDRALAMLKY